MAEYLLRYRLDDLKPHYKIQFLQSVFWIDFFDSKSQITDDPHINPSKIGLDRKLYDPSQF